MIEKSTTISNPTGLHARPAALLVNLIKKYDCNVTLKVKDKVANPKSVLNLLSLGLSQGTEVLVSVDGANEEKLADEIVEFLANFSD